MMRIFIFACAVTLSALQAVNAQRVVWQDDFETTKGWTEYETKSGSAVVMEGVLKMKSEDDNTVFSKCKTSLDGNKDFTIQADATIKSGLKEGKFVGIVFDFYDKKNYICFYIEKGVVWFEQYKDGQLVRQENDYMKKMSKSDSKNIAIEVQCKAHRCTLLVNDEETLEMEDISVRSNRIGFFVTGNQEVTFDNVKLLQ